MASIWINLTMTISFCLPKPKNLRTHLIFDERHNLMSYHSSAAIEAYADVASSSLQNNEHLWQEKKVRPWMAIKETILLVVSLSSPLLMALEDNEEIKNERKRTNGGAKKMKNIWKTKGIKEMERERGDEEKRFFRLERLGVW